jgi:hypothetical protein
MKSGNVCLLTIKANPVTKRIIMDVEWSKCPSKKDIREIQEEVHDMVAGTASSLLPPLTIEDDKEREAYTSEFLNPSGNTEKQ